MNLLRSSLITLATLTALSALAVPAKREPRTFTQPDGSQVTLTLVGDEFGHFYITDDGQVVLAKDKGFYFASLDSKGDLTTSSHLASDQSKRTPQQASFLRGINPAMLRQAVAENAAGSPLHRGPQKAVAQAGVGLFPNNNVKHSGSPHFLIILVEYQDVKFHTNYSTNAKNYFTNMLTQVGFSESNGTGSAYDYFNQASAGQFTPSFDVYGPITLSQDMAYYGGNSSATRGSDTNPAMMVYEACQQLDSTVDFAQYDTDNNGEVDNVFIIYAGQGEASYGTADSVWPHAWYLYDGARKTLYCDGKKINRYGCTNEWVQTTPDGVGTFIHEFSHVLGLPDLYATDYNDDTLYITPNAYDVMDYGPYNNNGRTPPTYSAFERNAMKWIDPTPLTAGEAKTLSLDHILTSNTAYIIPKPNSTTEFFLLENRQKSGWDAYIPGKGMLIWHIDYDATTWTGNRPNNVATRQRVDIEEANGTANSNSTTTMAKYPFPGTGKVKSFNGFTTWAGTTLNYPLTNIAESNGRITFDVCGGGIYVNPPTTNLQSGTYSNPISLTITPYNNTDKIYYTWLDANTDIVSDGEYTAPLEISDYALLDIWSKLENKESEHIDREFFFKAAKPVITPASASVTAMPEIEITCATEGASIYYTTSTTAEFSTSTWTLYSNKFTPSGASPLTIRAIAIKDRWINSDEAAATYTIKASDPGQSDPNIFTLVTDASTLQAGQRAIIVAANSNFAMSTTQNGSNRGQTAITKVGNTITPTADVQILTLEKSGDKFMFNTGSGYLVATSKDSNELKTDSNPGDYGTATVTVTSAGVATITFSAGKRTIIRHNSSSKLFACYASGQADISIYTAAASTATPDPDEPDPDDPDDHNTDINPNPPSGTPTDLKQNVTFDFNVENAYGMEVQSSSSTTETYNPDGFTITGHGITVTLNDRTRLWSPSTNTYELRIYKNASFTLTAPDGYLLKSVKLSSTANWSISNGQWTGSAQTLTISNTKSSANSISTMIVEIEASANTLGDVNTTLNHGDNFTMGSDLVVIYSHAPHIYLYDSTNDTYGYMHSTDFTVNSGDVITRGWSGQVNIDGATHGMKPDASTVALSSNNGNLPDATQIAYINHAEDFTTSQLHHIVRVYDVIMPWTATSDGFRAQLNPPLNPSVIAGAQSADGMAKANAQPIYMTFTNKFDQIIPTTLKQGEYLVYDYVDGVVGQSPDGLEVYPTNFADNPTTTGIATIHADQITDDMEIYNLQGIRATHPVAGIYLLKTPNGFVKRVIN